MIPTQRFTELATSLFYGSVNIDKLKLTVDGDQLQDEEYQLYCLRNCVSKAPATYDVLCFLNAKFTKVEVPGAAVWER